MFICSLIQIVTKIFKQNKKMLVTLYFKVQFSLLTN